MKELETSLVEFCREAADANIPLFLGGGYGLYIKQLHLLETRERTFLPASAWPSPRGTPDLDVFLPSEIVVDLKQFKALRGILDRLGYKPVEGAEFMHFERDVEHGQVRIELLTGPLEPDLAKQAKVKPPRVRPKGRVELHAYLTKEAIALEVAPLSIHVQGIAVRIPNPFSFLLMKLHASNDRIDDDDKQLGRHHALDVYRILAMLTEAERTTVEELYKAHRDTTSVVSEAAQIAQTMFADTTSRCVIRMQEHALAHDGLEIERALSLLHDLLGGA
ncbi:MAG: hypothetical protein Tsb0020_11680 [Haliangiales bacterium]